MDFHDGPAHAAQDLGMLKQLRTVASYVANDPNLYSSRLYHLESVLKHLYTRECAPFLHGDRVTLKETPEISDTSGWRGARHFLVKGAVGTVHGIVMTAQGWSVGVTFDQESRLDCDGKAHAPQEDRRAVYSFAANKLARMAESTTAPDVQVFLFRKRLQDTSCYAMIAVPQNLLADKSPIPAFYDLAHSAPDCARETWHRVLVRELPNAEEHEFLEYVAAQCLVPRATWLPELVYTACLNLEPVAALPAMLARADEANSLMLALYRTGTTVKTTVVDMDESQIFDLGE